MTRSIAHPAYDRSKLTPGIVHIGLGDASQVDRLIIHWPSGARQELTHLAADRHIVVEEGKEPNAAVQTVVPGQTVAP